MAVKRTKTLGRLKGFKAVDAEIPEVSIDEYTMMTAIERIVLVARRCELDPEKIDNAYNALHYVCRRTGMSEIQAMMFALCVEFSTDSKITIMDFCRWINCPVVSMLKYQNELDELMDKGYLMSGASDDDDEKCYAMPKRVMQGLAKNEVVTDGNTKDLSFEDFFNTMGEYFMSRRQGWSYGQMANHINTLVDNNPKLSYCKNIKSLSGLDSVSKVLLHYCCHRLVNHNDSEIMEMKLIDIFERRSDCAKIIRGIVRENHPLTKLGLIELSSEQGMVGEPIFTLSNKARQSILVEADVDLLEDAQAVRSSELVAHDKIKTKHMFYPQAVEGQISRLSSLLDQESFMNICQRLEESGLRRGFACLFYGVPGTGKTETVLQLARMTGRDIMQIDIAEMRSKWVGESQKMVKGMFDRYRRAVKRSKVAPILLFNEADAILTRRKSDSESSVDKMENVMQNIFLQEIENLEGILIATTNLTDNLDQAFERRFLYKVKFEQPDTQCRAKIWQALIDDISDDEAHALAERYNFSGGQIENVSRKQVVDSILYGKTTDRMSRLRSYCESELLEGSYQAKKVGFIA